MRNVTFTILLFLSVLQVAAVDMTTKSFYSKQPAADWTEALVTGNGIMGAMVDGVPHAESITLNHANLFLPINPVMMPPSQGKHLDEIRQMMMEGKFREASQFVTDLANAEGYNVKHATNPFVPAFRIRVRSLPSVGSKDVDTTYYNYRRSVDFTTGEVCVTWNDDKGQYERNVFVSRADNVVVIRLKAVKGEINADLRLERITISDSKRRVKFRLDERDRIDAVIHGGETPYLYYRAKFQSPDKSPLYTGFEGYEGVLKVVSADGKVKYTDGGLRLTGVHEALIFARVDMTDDFDASKVKDMADTLDNLSKDYNTLLASHAKIHGELFGRVSFQLDADESERRLSSEDLLAKGGLNHALIERLFAAARYNVLSSTGLHAPNLQGIWGGTMTPSWSGDFTTNGNLPVAVSHYLQANTPELMLPLLDQLDSFMDNFRTNAKVLFNCRGIHIPSHYTLHGLDNHFDTTWPMTFWVAGAPWYGLFYYDYYLYTGDRDFLRHRALPFMQEAMLFFEDFLIEGPDGRYIISPSYSPENQPTGANSQACINATMDVMAVNGLLRACIEASETLGINRDKVALWKKMQAKMPPYELNSDGELREWMWKNLKDNHNHRHASHLFGLYDRHDPLIMNNAAVSEGCRRVIERRMQFRRKENTGVMAFGICQLAFSAASLGESDKCEEMLGWLGSNYWNRNMFSTHDPHKIFNCDISGGYPSLIMKMLVYSDRGFVSLLPAIPSGWRKGSLCGTALRGGIIMERLAWNGSKVSVTLKSQTDQNIVLKLRNKTVRKVRLKAAHPVTINL